MVPRFCWAEFYSGNPLGPRLDFKAIPPPPPANGCSVTVTSCPCFDQYSFIIATSGDIYLTNPSATDGFVEKNRRAGRALERNTGDHAIGGIG